VSSSVSSIEFDDDDDDDVRDLTTTIVATIQANNTIAAAMIGINNIKLKEDVDSEGGPAA
jgi:hypothetical protein